MSDLEIPLGEVERALGALGRSEWQPVRAAVARAAALARFEARPERDGPFLRVDFGPTPQVPGPRFPAFEALSKGVDPRLADLMRALEDLQKALVWAADCAEFTDARLNSIQYLSAAGHVEEAARLVAAAAQGGAGLDPPAGT